MERIMKVEHVDYADLFKEYFEEQVIYVEKVRGIKHDMHAHMIVLYYYLEAGCLEKAKEYIGSIMESHKECEWPVEDVGNSAVNAVIFSALKRSKKAIEFHHLGLLPETLSIKDIDLCILFSNAFSNCVEACNKLVYTEPRVFLEIGQQDDNMYIVIENPIEAPVDKAILGVGTTKNEKEEHGYGIRNMKRIVEKYHGHMCFEIKEETFRIKFYFPTL